MEFSLLPRMPSEATLFVPLRSPNHSISLSHHYHHQPCQMEDILATFDGAFKEQETANSNWLPVRDMKVSRAPLNQKHNAQRQRQKERLRKRKRQSQTPGQNIRQNKGIECFDSCNTFRLKQKLQRALKSWSNFSLVLFGKRQEIHRLNDLTNPRNKF